MPTYSDVLKTLSEVVAALEEISRNARRAGNETQAISAIACKMRVHDAAVQYERSHAQDSVRESFLEKFKPGR